VVIDERWFTVEDVAERLKVTEETVRRWLRSGDLAGRNFGGRTGYRIREADINDFLARAGDAKKAAA
jgi:excisionase family DNA binding protein